ncbi:MAG TPA: ribonuclease HII, partial [Candidatus Dojkabacteria bacterium]|nr:ribonuclease HII [Candidatus Dojkabacteria bacterium]
GYINVAGLDEVGRGPLAGPVVASCVVVLGEDQIVEGVKDSKKMTEKRREEAFEKIKEKSAGYGVGIIDNERIDEIGIRYAVREAMIDAIYNMVKEFKIDPNYLIADGGILLIDDYEMRSIVRGDMYHYSISAASVLAKVTRDRIMKEYAVKYPDYGFESHVGYGTKKHIEAIYKYGITDIHRKSFEPIKSLVYNSKD